MGQWLVGRFDPLPRRGGWVLKGVFRVGRNSEAAENISEAAGRASEAVERASEATEGLRSS